MVLFRVQYLGDLAEAGRVDGPVLADGYRVPALVLRLIHSASSSSTRVFLGQKLLLHFNLLSVLLQFCLFMDLVNGLRAQVTSPGNPVILSTQKRDSDIGSVFWLWFGSDKEPLLFTPCFYNQRNITHLIIIIKFNALWDRNKNKAPVLKHG